MLSADEEFRKKYGLAEPIKGAENMLEHYRQRRNRQLLAELFQNSGQTDRAREIMKTDTVPEPLNSLLFKNEL